MMLIWKALIRDELGNVKYRSPEFNKKWIAIKWASNIIDKHKKLDEWFYEVWCE